MKLLKISIVFMGMHLAAAVYSLGCTDFSGIWKFQCTNRDGVMFFENIGQIHQTGCNLFLWAGENLLIDGISSQQFESADVRIHSEGTNQWDSTQSTIMITRKWMRERLGGVYKEWSTGTISMIDGKIYEVSNWSKSGRDTCVGERVTVDTASSDSKSNSPVRVFRAPSGAPLF